MLVICWNPLSTLMSIFNCMEGCNINNRAIKGKVTEVDKSIQSTDCSFFNGSSNVQTAIAIICAMFPWAICFHCGEHVLSLFCSNLSKLKSIQVGKSIFSVLNFSNSFSCWNLCWCIVGSTMFLDLVQTMVYMHNWWLEQKHSKVARRFAHHEVLANILLHGFIPFIGCLDRKQLSRQQFTIPTLLI